jgi:hypothetical protein
MVSLFALSLLSACVHEAPEKPAHHPTLKATSYNEEEKMYVVEIDSIRECQGRAVSILVEDGLSDIKVSCGKTTYLVPSKSDWHRAGFIIRETEGKPFTILLNNPSCTGKSFLVTAPADREEPSFTCVNYEVPLPKTEKNFLFVVNR